LHGEQVLKNPTPSEKQRQLDFKNNSMQADFFSKTNFFRKTTTARFQKEFTASRFFFQHPLLQKSNGT
jgi:hypothetical protein